MITVVTRPYLIWGYRSTPALFIVKKRMEESPEDQIKTLQSKIALLKAVGHM